MMMKFVEGGGVYILNEEMYDLNFALGDFAYCGTNIGMES